MNENAETKTESTPPARKRRRVAAIVIAVIVVLALLLPVSNLFLSPVTGTVLAGAAQGHPVFADAAAVLEHDCLDCHSDHTRKPLYMWIPVASGLIKRDIATGIRYFDMFAELPPPAGRSFAQPALAKMEYVLDQRTMPPARYVALHWDRALSDEDETALRKWITQTRRDHHQVEGVSARFEVDALQPLPQSVDLNAEKVALGDALYHDVRLSKDDTLSCASCHGLDKGGTDQAPVSTGVGNAKGPINAPTVYNSGFNIRQFWDGRAADLQEQAAGPVQNPIEMASTWEQVFGKLAQDEALMARITAVYPDGLNSANITDAIAEFERSLITPRNRFDTYLRGDETALSADELEGLRLFRENACANCHCGSILGGRSFERMGRRADYFADRGNVVKEDYGRYNETQNERDRHAFKVPTLRNIELTFPYYHDGTRTTLEQAAADMAKYQGYRDFSDAETTAVVKFLKTLTGEQRDGRLY
jgi:cytochrome c peroxidase